MVFPQKKKRGEVVNLKEEKNTGGTSFFNGFSHTCVALTHVMLLRVRDGFRFASSPLIKPFRREGRAEFRNEIAWR